MPNLPHTSEISANMYSKLTERLEDEVIRPNKVEILPSGLEGVTDGLARLEKGQVSASKLIARPQLTGTIPEKLTVSTKAVQGEKGPIENEKKVVKRRSLFRRIIP